MPRPFLLPADNSRLNSEKRGARLPKCFCGPPALVRARKKKTAVRIAYT